MPQKPQTFLSLLNLNILKTLSLCILIKESITDLKQTSLSLFNA